MKRFLLDDDGIRPASPPSDQALQQQLQLPHFGLGIERIVGKVEDGDGQRAVVAVAFQKSDDSIVFDLPLTDEHLKLIRFAAGVGK